ncbi:MAG: hypothetical protein ABIH27_06410 [Candidatus Omnitrophota bacterium]
MNKSKMKRISNLILIFLLVISVTGCEAFVRKFTRKPKEKITAEELVLIPEEYKPPQLSKEEKYRDTFFFWKNWHDEMINSLSNSDNHKKQIDCVKESINSLQALRLLLNTDKQTGLDIYLNKMDILKFRIIEDIYGSELSSLHLDAEKLKRDIQREFSYDKVKKCLI